MCECIPEVDGKLQSYNTRLSLPLMLGEDQTKRLMVVTEQVETGRGKKKAVAMFASFCPFCGERYVAVGADGKALKKAA